MKTSSLQFVGRQANGSVEKKHLVDGKYSIKDLVDIGKLRKLFEEFSKTTGFTTGFISYPDQEVLIATGWRDACTQFHRPCTASLEACRESNIYLTNCLKNLKELSIKPCSNGLVDGATPVIIRGKHLASVSTGQILFEPPDLTVFRKRARQYGFDEKAYLAAIRKVPVVSRQQFKQALKYLSDLAVFVAEEGLNSLRIGESSKLLRKENKRRRNSEHALKTSEEKYRTLFEGSLDAIFISGRDGRFLDCNEAGMRLFKYSSKNHLISMHPAELSPEKQEDGRDSETVARGYIKEVFKKGSCFFEWLHQRKDGTIFPTEILLSCVKMGEKTVIQGVLRDISERRSAEKSLRENSNLMNNIINSSTDFIFSKDTKLRTMLCNETFSQVFGKHPADLYGKTDIQNGWDPLYVKGDPARGIRGYEADDLAVLRGETVFIPAEIAPINGTIHFLETKKLPLKDSEGRIIGVLGVARDVTERRNMETRLIRANRVLRAIDECNSAVLRVKTERELVQEACKVIVGTGEYKMAWVGIPSQNRIKSIHAVAHAGLAGRLFKRASVAWSDTIRGRGPAGTAVRTKKAALFSNLQNMRLSAQLKRDAREQGWKSAIGLPMMIDGKCHGVLSIFSDDPDAFDEDQRQLLEGLVRNLINGIIMLRTRRERERLQANMLHLGERMQRDLGQELHDDLGQQLSGAALLAAVIKKNLGKSGNKLEEDAQHLVEILNSANATTRALAHGIYPVDLAPGGLRLALEELATRTSQLPGINCILKSGAVSRFRHHGAIHVYRIVQESMNNAIKHGHARNIAIDYFTAPHPHAVIVTSDGLPFPGAKNDGDGIGLPLMKYRARLIGARLEITRGKKGGCKVACTFPA
jgi:PAS domain S-box-containing protein